MTSESSTPTIAQSNLLALRNQYPELNGLSDAKFAKKVWDSNKDLYGENGLDETEFYKRLGFGGADNSLAGDFFRTAGDSFGSSFDNFKTLAKEKAGISPQEQELNQRIIEAKLRGDVEGVKALQQEAIDKGYASGAVLEQINANQARQEAAQGNRNLNSLIGQEDFSGDSISDSLKNAWNDDSLTSAIAQSIAQSTPSILAKAPAVVGTLALGPVGAAAGIGLGAAGIYGYDRAVENDPQQFEDQVRRQVAVTNPELAKDPNLMLQLSQTQEGQQLLNDAYAKSQSRANTVGLMAAGSELLMSAPAAGVAKLGLGGAKGVLAKGAAEYALQGGMGAGGEALGQEITDNQIYSPMQVFLEGALELPDAVMGTAMDLKKHGNETPTPKVDGTPDTGISTSHEEADPETAAAVSQITNNYQAVASGVDPSTLVNTPEDTTDYTQKASDLKTQASDLETKADEMVQSGLYAYESPEVKDLLKQANEARNQASVYENALNQQVVTPIETTANTDDYAARVSAALQSGDAKEMERIQQESVQRAADKATGKKLEKGAKATFSITKDKNTVVVSDPTGAVHHLPLEEAVNSDILTNQQKGRLQGILTKKQLDAKAESDAAEAKAQQNKQKALEEDAKKGQAAKVVPTKDGENVKVTFGDKSTKTLSNADALMHPSLSDEQKQIVQNQIDTLTAKQQAKANAEALEIAKKEAKGVLGTQAKVVTEAAKTVPASVAKEEVKGTHKGFLDVQKTKINNAQSIEDVNKLLNEAKTAHANTLVSLGKLTPEVAAQGTQAETKVATQVAAKKTVRDNNPKTSKTVAKRKANLEKIKKQVQLDPLNTAVAEELIYHPLNTEKVNPGVLQRIQDVITKIHPDINIKFADFLDAVEGNSTEPLRGAQVGNTIYVAMNQGNPNVDETAYHEAYHFIKGSGVLSSSDLSLLYNSTDDLAKAISKVYGMTESEVKRLAAADHEEVEAIAYGLHASGQLSSVGKPTTVFNKIKQFLSKLKNAFNGQGFRTYEDLFNDITDGVYSNSQINQRAMHLSAVKRQQQVIMGVQLNANSTETLKNLDMHKVFEAVDNGVKDGTNEYLAACDNVMKRNAVYAIADGRTLAGSNQMEGTFLAAQDAKETFENTVAKELTSPALEDPRNASMVNITCEVLDHMQQTKQPLQFVKNKQGESVLAYKKNNRVYLLSKAETDLAREHQMLQKKALFLMKRGLFEKMLDSLSKLGIDTTMFTTGDEQAIRKNLSFIAGLSSFPVEDKLAERYVKGSLQLIDGLDTLYNDPVPYVPHKWHSRYRMVAKDKTGKVIGSTDVHSLSGDYPTESAIKLSTQQLKAEVDKLGVEYTMSDKPIVFSLDDLRKKYGNRSDFIMSFATYFNETNPEVMDLLMNRAEALSMNDEELGKLGKSFMHRSDVVGYSRDWATVNRKASMNSARTISNLMFGNRFRALIEETRQRLNRQPGTAARQFDVFATNILNKGEYTSNTPIEAWIKRAGMFQTFSVMGWNIGTSAMQMTNLALNTPAFACKFGRNIPTNMWNTAHDAIKLMTYAKRYSFNEEFAKDMPKWVEANRDVFEKILGFKNKDTLNSAMEMIKYVATQGRMGAVAADTTLEHRKALMMAGFNTGTLAQQKLAKADINFENMVNSSLKLMGWAEKVTRLSSAITFAREMAVAQKKGVSMELIQDMINTEDHVFKAQMNLAAARGDDLHSAAVSAMIDNAFGMSTSAARSRWINPQRGGVYRLASVIFPFTNQITQITWNTLKTFGQAGWRNKQVGAFYLGSLFILGGLNGWPGFSLIANILDAINKEGPDTRARMRETVKDALMYIGASEGFSKAAGKYATDGYMGSGWSSRIAPSVVPFDYQVRNLFDAKKRGTDWMPIIGPAVSYVADVKNKAEKPGDALAVINTQAGKILNLIHDENEGAYSRGGNRILSPEQVREGGIKYAGEALMGTPDKLSEARIRDNNNYRISQLGAGDVSDRSALLEPMAHAYLAAKKAGNFAEMQRIKAEMFKLSLKAEQARAESIKKYYPKNPDASDMSVRKKAATAVASKIKDADTREQGGRSGASKYNNQQFIKDYKDNYND